ncbi:DUF2804 domain-containing protein [Cytobacillus sp. FSL R7-0696]|uniref:DUF2804 domain-containing protein n=1 Tax=Cytobacillus sp. FSL R7-0696 TaxID=2921691 RepID=UPI0030F8C0C5
MQREMTEAGHLLNDKGELVQAGYAKQLLLTYDRKAIKAQAWRIKEWDYYLVCNDDFGVALTIADNSYMALLSVSFLDFKRASYRTTSMMKPLTFGKLNLPSTSKEGDIVYQDKRIKLSFSHIKNGRKLCCHMKNFDGKTDFACDIDLVNEAKDSIVMAIPFKEDRQAFYYNQKINGMRAKGSVHYGQTEYQFQEKNSFATLDWGRGVWTYKNTWYWGSASGVVEGKTFGFNIGYGFGDTSLASENMLFYDGVAHKLEEVTFHIPQNNGIFDYLSPWRFTSSDGRFEMDFIPILDRKDHTSVIVISSDQHQVFGHFTGKAVLDDGTTIVLKDFLGFAERVENKW